MANWTAAQIPSQQGKLAIVTGANSGIGFHASRELARAGCVVILACRDKDKAAAARQRIVSEIPNALVEVGILDLASLASIRKFAAEFLVTGRVLDLLINNAGVMAYPTRRVTADGFEAQFGTNHLGHFALTGLLLLAILAAPAARIVTVSSIAHKGASIHFDDLQWERSYQDWGAYRQSKLANLLFGFELERRLRSAGTRAISVVVHPGVAATSIFKNGPGANGLFNKFKSQVVDIISQPDDRGALPTLYGAVSPEAQGGKYYGPNGFKEIRGYPVEVQAEPPAKNVADAKRLWKSSEELTGVIYTAIDGVS
jgi:NAD(P)-dependent dehydrogenase (short-subunit alcohol dehydrogenase family)